MTYKIILIGASGVGKTAIVDQLCYKDFSADVQPTVMLQFSSYSVQADGENVKLQIWDTSGQERFRTMTKVFFRDAVGAILVFDLTHKRSLDELNEWINDINALCAPNVFIILVGNKSDLIDSRDVSEREINAFASQHNLEYVEVSAKTGTNIEHVFERVAQECVRRDLTDKRESEATTVQKFPRSFQVPGAERLRQMAFLGENDFTFVVDDREYPCSRFQAVFISQRVCRLLQSDALVDRILIDLPKEGGSVDEIMSLMNGESITITEENLQFVKKCARALENDYLLQEVVRITLEDELDISNVFQRIRLKKESHLDCHEEYEFLAAHFCDLDTEVIESSLSSCDLDQVLASDKLIVESEDALFSVLNRLIGERGGDYVTLLRHVRFPLLGKDNLRLFLDMASSDALDYLWPQIRQCLETFCDSPSKPSVFTEGRKYRKDTHT